MDYRNRGPLIRVQIGPGRFVQMYEKDAIAQGLLRKEKPQAENKMRMSVENKTPESTVHKPAEIPIEERDDFTEIPGVGKATCEALYAHGVYTFDQLLTADISYLSNKARPAIEAWRESLEE